MKTPTCTSRPACDCHVRFELPVALLACAGQAGVAACLCCGTLSWSNELLAQNTASAQTRAAHDATLSTAA